MLVNYCPYFTAFQYIKNLKTKRSYKREINLKNFIFKKNLSTGLKIIR